MQNRKPSNAVQRLRVKAFDAGMRAALEKAVPQIEARYRVWAVTRVWLLVLCVSSIAFAAGWAIGEAL